MSVYFKTNKTFTDLSMFSSPSINVSDDNSGFFSITARDWPILIGAVVGAIGLVVLILCAISIWFCCQYANNSANTYKLNGEDSDSCHNFKFEENKNLSKTNDLRNFSKIDKVLLLRPSAMDLSKETNFSSNYKINSNQLVTPKTINFQNDLFLKESRSSSKINLF